MNFARAFALILALLPAPAAADGIAGEFDYYVLSLSWSPTWCRLEGVAEGSPQCAPEADFAWVLHGLWPQYDAGWPDYCDTAHPPPTRRMTAAMADVMGTAGLAWHQWRKHGSCSGLAPADYFALAREALARVARPEVFARLDREVTLPAHVVEEAFTAENPGLDPPEVTVTCRSRMIQEVRVCFTRELEFRQCGADVIRDCSIDDALLLPVR